MDINSSLIAADASSIKKSVAAPNKISGSGRVSRVCAKFAYILSEKYGSIFALPDNFVPPSNIVSNDGDKRAPDLDKFLRVDDLVHFTAVPQNGVNNCFWKTLKFSKSVANNKLCDDNVCEIPPSAECVDSNFGGDGNDVYINNVRGTVVEVYDKFGFVWSDLYGRIYLPLNACFTYGTDGCEFQKLSDCFLMDDIVVFDAERQPELNGCRYAVTSIQLCQDDMIQQQDLTTSLSKNINPTKTMTSQQQQTLPMEYGVVAKLFPTFGFIQCAKYGNVFFTLSNFIDFSTVANDGDQSPSLLQTLAEGQSVQFLPTPQPEKSGCVWRAIRVQKASSKSVASGDFAELVDYLKLNETDDCSDVVMEVACQTDQSLWNTFLVGQLPRSSRGRSSKLSMQDVACQTTNPPELLLLKALKTNCQFMQELKEKFPDLMKYVEKTSL